MDVSFLGLYNVVASSQPIMHFLLHFRHLIRLLVVIACSISAGVLRFWIPPQSIAWRLFESDHFGLT